ncbi:MAG: hypothetical protein IJP91_00685 [Synergistaceae bacterium]|nr:hypothetical protein [Synergistaceae bacterium]
MPNYDVNSVLQFGRLKEFGQAVATELTAMKAVSASAIKSANVVGNAIKLYTSTDMSGTAAFSLDFPSELVLDALHTTFVGSFTFNAETYPGATNPSLDGKPVLVIAVKETTAAGTVTTTYSFLNLESLIDTYTVALGDSAKVLTINGYVITFHVSASAGNHLTVNNDGLMVDVSDKADKDTDAVAGNLAVFDANHNPVDSGYTFATTANVTELVNELFPSA